MLEIRARDVPKSSCSVVALKTKASIPLIANILSNTKVREIVCSRAIYKTIPPRAIKALKKMKIEVRITNPARGRPRKYGEKTCVRILKMLRAGKTHKSVSKELKIPLRTVYHIRKTFRKANKSNRSKK